MAQGGCSHSHAPRFVKGVGFIGTGHTYIHIHYMKSGEIGVWFAGFDSSKAIKLAGFVKDGHI